jgi:high-affinity Fe2+/Pb2+ permease
MSYSEFNKQNGETLENYKARLQRNYTNIGQASRNASTEDRQNYSNQRSYIQQKLNNISSNQQQSDQKVSQNTAATVVNNPVVNTSAVIKRKISKKPLKQATTQTQLIADDKDNYQKSLNIYNMLNSKYTELDNDFTNIKENIDNYLTTLDGIVVKNINIMI